MIWLMPSLPIKNVEKVGKTVSLILLCIGSRSFTISLNEKWRWAIFNLPKRYTGSTIRKIGTSVQFLLTCSHNKCRNNSLRGNWWD